MMRSFSQAVRATIDAYYEGIRRRSAMYGTPAEIEAMWWTLLSFEATTLEPIPDDDVIENAKRDAHERVAKAHGWLGNLPFHVQESWREGLVVVLDEWRTEFLARLRSQ